MASLIYNGTTSQTTTYAATDIYTIQVPISSITNVSQQGANVVIQTGATSLTIAGVTLAQLANTNFAVQGGGFIQFGDGTADTAADQFGNTVAQGANNNGGLVLGLGGGDTITLGNGANLVYGGTGVTDPQDGGDTITTGTGNDTIYGNGGDDVIVSGGGQDIVFGGVGIDQITTGALTGNTSVYGGGGFTDTVDGADTILIASNTGNLFVTGNAGADAITLTTSTGNASVYGGIGADNIVVGAAGTSVTGGNYLIAGGSSAGNTDVDNITFRASGSSNVTIYGGVGVTDTNDGVDNINATVGSGSAFIYGNSGNDVINLTTDGVASIYGGTGSDQIAVTGTATARVQIFGGPNAAGVNETISVANLVAGAGATIFGGTGLNDSADGADSITGGASNDVIYGNGGNDTIISGAGNDQISGGAGADSFIISGTGNKVITDFGTGADSLFLDTVALGNLTSVAATSTGAQISFATTANPAVLTNIAVGGTIPTTFTATLERAGGAAGVADNNDGILSVVTTTAGTAVVGGANADYLAGNAGADNIVGGAGVDTIIGGAGVDTLTGGDGNDVFRFRVNGDSGTTSVNVAATAIDRITDAATGDIIDFDSSSDLAATNDAVIAANLANNFAGGVATGNLQTAVTAATTFAAALDLVEAALGANAVAGFTYGGNSYIVHNDGTANNDVIDNVIQLTGVTITGVAENTTTDTFTITI